MILFTGSGRSGTGLYSKLFATHHEYQVKRLARSIQTMRGYRSPPTDLLADPEVRLRILRRHLDGVDLHSFRDSSNPYVHLLDAAYRLDQDLRIVLGVRDGRDFVRSGITRGYHLPDGLPRPGAWRAVRRRVRWAMGLQRPPIFTGFGLEPEGDDPLHSAWPTMSPVEKMAWLWQYRNQKALTRLAGVPKDRWTVVRLEDLTGEPGRGLQELERLEAFLGMSADRQWLTRKYNHSDTLAHPGHDDWAAADVAGFRRIAGATMERLGYALA